MSLRFKSTHEIVEYLSRLEHEQWISWSRSVAHEVSEECRKKWEASWVPYEDLPEHMKEKDRVWAVKVLTILNIIREDDLIKLVDKLRTDLEENMSRMKPNGPHNDKG